MWELGMLSGIAAAYGSQYEARRRAAESLAKLEAQTAALSNLVPGSVPRDLYAQLMLASRNLSGYTNTGTCLTGRFNASSIVRCAYCRRERHGALRTKRCEGCGASEVLK